MSACISQPTALLGMSARIKLQFFDQRNKTVFPFTGIQSAVGNYLCHIHTYIHTCQPDMNGLFCSAAGNDIGIR